MKSCSRVIALGIAAILCGCVIAPNANKPPESQAPVLPAQTQYPVNIRVVDQRPQEETVWDKNYSSGYEYTTYGAEGQARNFVFNIGENIKRGHGAPDYRNLNGKGAIPHPSGLNFTFTLKHWYARWPLRNVKDPVLVEGVFDVVLDVSRNGKLVYRNAYRTEGKPQLATLQGINKDNYFDFVHKNIGHKGDQVLFAIVEMIVTDLQKNWITIVNGEKI